MEKKSRVITKKIPDKPYRTFTDEYSRILEDK